MTIATHDASTDRFVVSHGLRSWIAFDVAPAPQMQSCAQPSGNLCQQQYVRVDDHVVRL